MKSIVMGLVVVLVGLFVLDISFAVQTIESGVVVDSGAGWTGWSDIYLIDNDNKIKPTTVNQKLDKHTRHSFEVTKGRLTGYTYSVIKPN